MMQLNTCEIVNQIDSKCFTVFVEWLNLHFKVMLLEPTMPPLSGKMDTKNINYFCNELGKSSDEYLQEIKKAFCGKDKEIQFFIQNNTFEWKRNVWTLGKIKLYPILDIQIVSQSFQSVLKLYQNVQDRISILEEENKNLMSANIDLVSKIEKLIENKTSMEQDLYSKFIVVLNSKKERIRELETIIKEKEGTAESVFNLPTDESEKSGDENEKLDNNLTLHTKVKKRKTVSNINPQNVQKARKKASVVNKNCISNDEATNKFINKDCIVSNATSMQYSTVVGNTNIFEKPSCSSATRASRSSLNFTEEESEEELFS